MTASRRTALMALAGTAALGAGVAANWHRLRLTDSAEAALVNFWSREFETPNGARLATRTLQGNPLVLNFWATWCPPCVKEMPELDRFATAFGSRGWRVLGVAIDQGDAVRQFLRSTPVGFPVVLAGMEGLSLVRELGNPSGGLPFTVVVSSQGRIVQRKLGATTTEELQRWAELT